MLFKYNTYIGLREKWFSITTDYVKIVKEEELSKYGKVTEKEDKIILECNTPKLENLSFNYNIEIITKDKIDIIGCIFKENLNFKCKTSSDGND